MKQWRILAAITLFVAVASLVKAETPVNPSPTQSPKAVESGSVANPTGGNTTAVTPPTVEVAGTETRLLPANYDVWSCDWAPDGKAMVFSGKIQGELSTKMRVWMWKLDPITTPVPFTNTENLTDYSPRWSPDGKQLVMMRVTYGKSSAASGLWLKDVVTGTGKQLTIGNQDRDPAWAPDGKRIVFSRSYGPYQSQLIIIDTVESTLEVLLGQENEVLSSPCWGRDGKIYFTKMTPVYKSVEVGGQNYQVVDFGKGSIWAVDPRDRSVVAVVTDEYDNRMPALSPDGTKLAFVSDRVQGKEGNGKFDRGSLYIKNLATGEIKFVTNKVGLNGGSLTWSPDGKKLAFFTFRSIRPAVWVINVEPLFKAVTPAVTNQNSGQTPVPVQQ